MKVSFLLVLVASLLLAGCSNGRKLSILKTASTAANSIPFPTPFPTATATPNPTVPPPAALLPQPNDSSFPPLAPYYTFRSNRPLPPIADGRFLGEVAGKPFLSNSVIVGNSTYPLLFSRTVSLDSSGPYSRPLSDVVGINESCGLKYHGISTNGIPYGGVSCGTTQMNHLSTLVTTGDGGVIPRACSGSCLRTNGPIVPLAQGGMRLKMINVSLNEPGFARIPQGPWDVCKLTYSGTTYNNGTYPGGYACSVDFDRRLGAWIIGAKAERGADVACMASCFSVPRTAVPNRRVESATFFLGADRGVVEAFIPEEWDDCSLSHTGFFGLGEATMGGSLVKENSRWRLSARQLGDGVVDVAASCFRIR